MYNWQFIQANTQIIADEAGEITATSVKYVKQTQERFNGGPQQYLYQDLFKSKNNKMRNLTHSEQSCALNSAID